MPKKALRLPTFNTIGFAERANVLKALHKPLSGYLGGIRGGGYWVERLSAEWQETFNVRHAIPCNSCTSALLAACMAIKVGPEDEVWVSTYTMSATAAAPMVLGAKVRFLDIDIKRYSPSTFVYDTKPKAIIITNLFGHPAHLLSLKTWCDMNGVWLIEDNAQAPFAKEYECYTGTVGHIGCWSLNVHKALNAGEGGVVTTNLEMVANALHRAINHGELEENAPPNVGLNLRMTETTAAIACAQLKKAPVIVQGHRDLALELSDMFEGTLVRPPVEQDGCHAVYYLWAGTVQNIRNTIVEGLQNEGFPIRAGYSPLLSRLFSSEDPCPEGEDIEDNRIVIFEVCAWDPNVAHLKKMREIVKRIAS